MMLLSVGATAVLIAVASASCVKRAPQPPESRTPLVPGSKAPSARGEEGEQKEGRSSSRLATPEELSAIDGLDFRLREAEREKAVVEEIPRPRAEPIDDARAEALLSRLPPLEERAKDRAAFALRKSTEPPPQKGEIAREPFPPRKSAVPPKVERTALEIVRVEPTGEVPIAPHLAVTFSEPMVQVTGVEDLAAREVPVKLDPTPRGRWRWIGTRTVLFEPEERFPMATEYRVEVPKGTRALSNAGLSETKAWTFATPPPEVVQLHPQGGPQPREPIFLAVFDQAIDPDPVLKTIRVSDKASTFALRLATKEEIERDPDVRRSSESAIAGRWVAFRPVEPFPIGDRIAISVGPNTPSKEGPRKKTRPSVYSLTTYSELAVRDHRCGWGPKCAPLQPLTIWFNNALDADAFEDAWVRTDPPIEGMRVSAGGAALTIQGATKGRRRYAVTVAGALKDQFGQILGHDTTLTFDVGPAEPGLYDQGGLLSTLDPAGKPALSVFSINYPRLDVKIWTVTPSDYPRFVKLSQRYDLEIAKMPGRKVRDGTIQVSGKPDELTETPIDLSSHLATGRGHAIVLVQPPPDLIPKEMKRSPPRVVKWVQATELALDAVADSESMTAWVTDLASGAPVEGADVELVPDGVRAVSNAQGLASLALPSGPDKSIPMLIATRGSDRAFLTQAYGYEGQGYGAWRRKRQAAEVLTFYTFDDRRLYRPGEQVHVKGWVRRVSSAKNGDVLPLEGIPKAILWEARDAQGHEIQKGEAAMNALGGFTFALAIPENASLGPATIGLRAKDAPKETVQSGTSHTFEIEEFRRPEFEVSASAREGPHIVGRSASASVHAAYYAGGGLAAAAVSWQATASPASYAPPNRGDYTFGVVAPWWRSHDGFSRPTRRRPPAVKTVSPQYQTLAGKTDANGDHRIAIDLFGSNPPRPMTVSLESTVMDVNRQAWSASTSLLVHPSSLYVGLKTERAFVLEKESIEIDAIACDIDGNLIADRTIDVRAVRLEWRRKKGAWSEEEVEARECRVTSPSRSERPAHCKLETSGGGRYLVRAAISDDRGRRNETEIELWVAGERSVPDRGVAQDAVDLIPDKKEYRVGERAKILARAPFVPAEGLLVLARGGIVEQRRFTMSEPTKLLEIEIQEAYIPDLHVQVELAGRVARAGEAARDKLGLPPRPAYASGAAVLTVPPVGRTLSVVAAPKEKAVEPGSETSVALRVADADGKPVPGADVAIAIVDESVLALAGYRVPNPIQSFYPPRGPGTTEYRSRASIVLASASRLVSEMEGASGEVSPDLSAAYGERLAEIASPAPTPGNGHARKRAIKLDALKVEGRMQKPMAILAGAPAQAESQAPIALRTNFDALALFAPDVATDRDGRAEVKVKMPDNLTRYRIVAVAASGHQRFGAGESSITARKTLMVRPSAPRFLNFGDAFELPIVVQNQSDEAKSVEVAVRASNIALAQGHGRRISVPANDRAEVRFPASAEQPGTARFQIAGASGALADAAEISLPVWTPATTEAFATYGEIDGGAIEQPVVPPKDAVAEFGGLEVSVASTQLQALTDAVLQIASYPFECSEQLASRIIAISALKDVLNAFEAPGMPKPKELLAAVDRDFNKLLGMQNADGGFPFWRRGGESWPFNSIHVAHAIARAKEKRFKVDALMTERAKQYLTEIERHYPNDYPKEIRRVLTAYALYVRFALDDKQPQKARELIQEAGGIEKLPIEAVAWLYPVLAHDPASKKQVEDIRRYFNNRVTETAGTAHFATAYSDGAYLLLHSDRRADGLILDGLIQDQPKSDLIAKIVRGLLAHRTKGAWGSTQENLWVLLALDRYFHTYEKTPPSFVARVWLGDGIAGEHRFRGRTTEIGRVEVPMPYLVAASAKSKSGEEELIVEKQGDGRLYYRIGLRYAPRSLKLDPFDAGFAVSRVYEGADDPEDVRRDREGTWHIRAGARVKVKIEMVAPSRRYHVALVDPLPAGLESLNAALAATGALPRETRPSGWWWWQSTWYQHQNLRDERSEAFSALVWEGVHEYVYYARATTPGRFVAAPSKAEEMYHPETFGRSAGDVVIVE
jgi:alpha-2-macroglobulin